MKKSSKHTLMSIIMGFLCAGWFFVPVVHGAEQIPDYQATYTIKKDGSMTIKEEFTYPVSDPIDHIDHRIGTNDTSQLQDLAISMRASNQSQSFPFVEGEAKDVGTYHLAKQGNDINLTLYNQMAKDNEIITTAVQLKNAWVKYDQTNILEFPLLRLPHDVQQAKITFSFPGDVSSQDVQLLATGVKGIEHWWTDKRTLVFDIPKASATESVNLTLGVPSSLLKDNQNEGPESKGKQILQRIQEEKQAQTQRNQWKRVLMWAIVVFSGIILVTYTVLLMKKKQQYRQDAPAYTSARTDATLYSPVVLAKVLKFPLTPERGLWMTLFALVARGTILVRWQLDKDKQLVDAHFTIREQKTDDSVAQYVLNALISKQAKEEVSFQELKYQKESAKRGSRSYRQLLRQIQRETNRIIDERGLIERRATLIFSIGWWICGMVLLTGLLGLIVLMSMVQQLYWLLAIMVIYGGWLFILKHRALPIYTGYGVNVRKYWRHYLNQLPSGQKNDQAAWEWTMDYLYSWLIQKNKEQYRALQHQGVADQVPFVRQLQPVTHTQLKNFK
ncbi:MAG: DUF2207 domain-containing protein [Aerococcus sp.]|nr:DUF2207 domain-containing protein [Aerococcus sp.]